MEKRSVLPVSPLVIPGNSKLESAGVSTSPQLYTDAQVIELEGMFELVLGSAMKRLLVSNDMYGSKILQKAILDEINKVQRYQREAFERVRATARNTEPQGEPIV
jgi:hypothetical protein